MSNEYKEALLNTGLFKRVTSSPHQYRCQTCPFCGDMKYHMYVLIKLDDDTPVLYNCKKCNASGILNKTFLEYFNLDDIQLPKNIRHKRLDVNKNASDDIGKCFVEEYGNDDICHYIQSRVGVFPSIDDLKAFQCITKPYDYAKEYLGYTGGYGYFKNRVWFKMTNGNITGRDITGDSELRWLRFKTIKTIGLGLYSIKTPVDIYKNVNICVCEGVMDAIGLYYHLKMDNCVYVACMGSDYYKGLQHAINMGVFGDSVSVGLYVDSDVLDKRLYVGNMGRLFKHVDVFRNTLDKDYGVKGDEIMIEKVRRLI